jgi:endonuclease YncB( thermonuclease family)
MRMVLDGKLLRVVDGDTYDVEVDVSHLNPEQPVWRGRIRCAYYNAPERKAVGGPEATAALMELLTQAPLRIETKGRDDWKRVVAETYPAGSMYRFRRR